MRTLETSHPPSYHIPREDIASGALVPADGTSFCEWKGHARYFDVIAATGDGRRARAAWSYPDPTPLAPGAQTSVTETLEIISRVCDRAEGQAHSSDHGETGR